MLKTLYFIKKTTNKDVKNNLKKNFHTANVSEFSISYDNCEMLPQEKL